MELHELQSELNRGEIDTVLLALCDMQGRLQGKRLVASYFLDEVAAHGVEGSNYLLAVDVDMSTVEGYAMSSWERGYGDMLLRPDLSTLRAAPWQEGTALCLADVAWLDGADVVASPRQILRRQIARLAERGWTAFAGTELEFMLFHDSYEQAWAQGYRDLHPANLYNVDHSLLGTARVEPLIRRIRNSMVAAGMAVEDSKGECNLGQHEINFHCADVLRTADDHVIYKNGAKEIAAQDGMAVTTVAWGRDNRTCSLRIVGHGRSLRFENRVGGADLNPCLALSALIASGLHGVDAGLELEPVFEGNAYLDHAHPRVPASLRDARDLFAASEVARAAFAADVVDRYVNAADVEPEAFGAAVIDWEGVRGFERL